MHGTDKGKDSIDKESPETSPSTMRVYYINMPLQLSREKTHDSIVMLGQENHYLGKIIPLRKNIIFTI